MELLTFFFLGIWWG